jgi:hypothetical protein
MDPALESFFEIMDGLYFPYEFAVRVDLGDRPIIDSNTCRPTNTVARHVAILVCSGDLCRLYIDVGNTKRFVAIYLSRYPDFHRMFCYLSAEDINKIVEAVSMFRARIDRYVDAIDKIAATKVLLG